MDHNKFILIPEEAYLEIGLVFIFWWLLISIPIHYASKYKKYKILVFKLLALLFILFLAMFIDSSMKLPDNPVTLTLLLVFFIGLFYVIAPKFFFKYRILIFIIYGIAVSYFTYVRLFSGDFDTYVELNKGRAFSMFFIPIPLFIGLWIFEQWKWFKSIKMEKAKAELELLQTQVNPHFFFNTLNNLYSLTIKHSDEAPKVILKLSEMMRYTIYEGKREQVLLKKEIEYLQNYIDLHALRYHKKVDIQFTNDCMESDQIAPLLFIILLENAFKHGVEKFTEEAYIHMHLESDARSINFSLENSFEPGEQTDDKGIGMDNLKRRLALTYPNQHSLNIKITDNVYSVKLKIDKV